MRLVNVLPLTRVMLAEYVPPDFELQQRKTAEDALSIIVGETGLEPRAGVGDGAPGQGGIYQEILEEAGSHRRRPDRDELAPAAAACRAHLLLGSNARHVVRYARCSVLVVRN